MITKRGEEMLKLIEEVGSYKNFSDKRKRALVQRNYPMTGTGNKASARLQRQIERGRKGK